MMKKDGVLRIIDANLNRTLEGLRIIEEIVRFILEDKRLTSTLKEIRHLIKEEIENLFEEEEIDGHRLLIARDARKDVGVSIYVSDEFRRLNLREILKVNFKRTEESLRVLEEFTKLIKPSSGLVFKKLRFRIYSLEKQFFTSYFLLLAPYPLSGLYVILDQSVRRDRTHLQIAKDAIAGGAKILQLREKRLADRGIIKIGREIRDLARRRKVLFIINDRVDLCLVLNADGVHLGQDDISARLARSILGNEKIIGISTHNFQQVIKAQDDGANYISIGPIFKTDIKPYLKPKGVDFIRKMKEKIKIPFFVIGGINEENIRQVLRTGARGVAVISAIMCARNIRQATKKLVGYTNRNT